MNGGGLLNAVLRRDRVIVFLALGAIASLAWAYTLAGVGMSMMAIDMTVMAGTGTMMTAPTYWSPTYALFIFLMWWIMMIAMMIPSAAPIVLLFAAMTRKRQTRAPPYLGTGAFLATYLAMWALFSAAAALLHWGLAASGLLTSTITVSGALPGGLLLIAVGLYQLTPLKQACLHQCRQPIEFIARHWRSGPLGALRMGARHGAYCLGCCWFLMGLLFFGGIMNVWWMVGIAAYVLVEKIVRCGHWLDYGAGIALTIAGAITLMDSL